MNKPCARCSKTVYPMEKLNCLDKTWHKGCFKCETCGMALTMKNYKGYNKLPYCSVHYPTTSFTAVADTPANLRAAQNTKQQSQIAYHSEFEKAKGKYTSVTDDPEILRNQKNMEQVSNIAYTGQRKVNQPEHATKAPGDHQRPASNYEPPSTEQVRAAMPVAPAPAPEVAPPAADVTKGVYKAVYDYTAADDDEVSFAEGDIIINGEPIDEGWMTGTVKRTGQHGMLPSNYVESM